MEGNMMKLIILITAVSIFASLAFGQSVKKSEALEQEIRKLEQQEADAVLRGDFDKLDKLWAEDYFVNSPFNKVNKASTGPIRSGSTKYSSFIREIESVQIHADTVVVMGQETVKPISNAVGAGALLTE
ncbi:MAG: nuclear transport factor 2 family protein [Pyrinomonadaceae bacterium]